MLGGGKVIFDLHDVGGVKGARVVVEECSVHSGSMDAILEVVTPHTILVGGVVRRGECRNMV